MKKQKLSGLLALTIEYDMTRQLNFEQLLQELTSIKEKSIFNFYYYNNY